jgi:dephospho-CoA kinase
MPWKHDRPIPVIGLVGGIGSGKSAVAAMFAAEGCAVIDSDKLVHEILQRTEVKAELQAGFGNAILDGAGNIDRRTLGKIVFSDPAKLARLNEIIHPLERQGREMMMAQILTENRYKAVVWDTPLLIEVGLNRECDVLIFVEVPHEIRAERVKKTRGWSPQELDLREKMQIPLDKKADVADYCVDNSGDQAASQRQVHHVLSRLLSKSNG